MNNIKYRIYDPINKKMIYSGSTPTMLSSFFKATAYLNTQYKMSYQLGLLISGGEGKSEFYEGDIVLPKASPSWAIAIIKWHLLDCTFRLYAPNNGWIPDRILESELVGNICENSELIKEIS